MSKEVKNLFTLFYICSHMKTILGFKEFSKQIMNTNKYVLSLLFSWNIFRYFKNLIFNLIFDIESINLISIYNLKYRCYYLVNYFIDWYCFYVIFQHIAVRTKYRCKIEGASNFNFRVTLFLRLSWTDVVLKLSIYHDCGFQWPLNNTIITFSVQYIYFVGTFLLFFEHLFFLLLLLQKSENKM